MKKFTRLLVMTWVVIAAMTACQDEEVLNTSQEKTAVSISVQTEGVVKTRGETNPKTSLTIPDGYTLRYILETWTDGKRYSRDIETVTATAAETSTEVSFDLQLLAGHDYELLFWADITDAADENGNSTEEKDFLYATDGGEKGLYAVTKKDTYNTFDGDKTDYKNAAVRDAFFYSKTFNTGAGNINENIVLKRALSQLNIYTDNDKFEEIPTEHKPDYTTVSIKAPGAFNVSTGKGFSASGELDEWTTSVQIKDEDPVTDTYKKVTKDADGNETTTDVTVNKLFTGYYFVEGSGVENNDVVNFTMTAYKSETDKVTEKAKVDLYNIPLRRNYRTNIYGSGLLTNDTKYTVVCDDNFEGDIDREVIYVSSDDEAKAALTIIQPTLNIVATKDVVNWEIPAGFAAKNIDISYSDTPASISITEKTSNRSGADTQEKKINLYIPASNAVINSVKLNTPNWKIGINEDKAGEISIASLEILGGTKVVTGSKVILEGDPFYDETTETYTVYTATGLRTVAESVNKKTTSGITLAADIDLSGINWTPICTGTDNRYKGTFDGNGKEITGLTINATTPVAGLIGYLGESGAVKNLTLIDCKVINEIERQENDKDAFLGAVVGRNEKGSVTKCIVKGNSTISAKRRYVGGIVGQNNEGTIENCEIIGEAGKTITINGYESIGGIVGQNCGEVKECKVTNAATGKISIQGQQIVGGIAGSNSLPQSTTFGTCKLTNCEVRNKSTDGSTTGISIMAEATGTAYNVGGIVGGATNSLIAKCTVYGCQIKATSEATTSQAHGVGGIIGFSYTNIINACVAEKNTVTGTSKVGGIVGRMGKSGDSLDNLDGTVIACYAKDMTILMTWEKDSNPADKQTVGGIVGINANADGNGNIIACYASGCTMKAKNEAVTTPAANVVGVNTYTGTTAQDGVITGCYYLSGTQVIAVNGTGEDVAADTKNPAVWYDSNAETGARCIMNKKIEETTLSEGSEKYYWNGDCNAPTLLTTKTQ